MESGAPIFFITSSLDFPAHLSFICSWGVFSFIVPVEQPTKPTSRNIVTIFIKAGCHDL